MQVNTTFHKQGNKPVFGNAIGPRVCKQARELIIDHLMPNGQLSTDAAGIIKVNPLPSHNLGKRIKARVKGIAEKIVSRLAPAPLSLSEEDAKKAAEARHLKKSEKALRAIETGIQKRGSAFIERVLEVLDRHNKPKEKPRVKTPELETIIPRELSEEERVNAAAQRMNALLQRNGERSARRAERAAENEKAEAIRALTGRDPGDEHAERLAIGASIRKAFKKSGHTHGTSGDATEKTTSHRKRRFSIQASTHRRQPVTSGLHPRTTAEENEIPQDASIADLLGWAKNI